jgi:tRNA pseudouridine55 synthase
MELIKSLEEFYDGKLLLVNKPLDWTSFDVVNKIRGTIQHKRNKLKVGHAGTLDPLATGLLIICTGKMTKSIQEFQELDKGYSGEITLGKTTPSYDAETEVDNVFPTEHITKEIIIKSAEEMEGVQEQFPPIYSAIKINGKTAYKEARKGREIELSSRKIDIKKFEIIEVKMPVVEFHVECSKGTYIRSLAHDFGKKLNSGGYLSKLQRESIGNFNLKDAYNLSDLIANIEALKNENTQRSS